MNEHDRHVVIGTAGHVDHGKTSLIRALTGHDTDRLAEEKDRGISIDLGFAPFRLPDGTTAGVVDVPGHERFISNMLAGIGGIDLVLLVVDVMEGVRPQTREHLHIMDILRIRRGVIVLNKCDLADADWIDLVEEEVRQEVAGTFLDGSPACRVSATTGLGIDGLVHTILETIRSVAPRDVTGALRLPVDRTFIVPGFGTVVSGTLLSGSVRVGESVEVFPAGRKVRVRGVQVHGQNVDRAYAGQRTALNLTDIERELVPRGSVIAEPSTLDLTSRFDARMRLLPTPLTARAGARALEHRDQVHLYAGTARTVATVVLLDRESLEPGDEAIVQVLLAEPLAVHRRDPFVLRSYSPMVTIGGGTVIDPQPPKHKRFRGDVLETLQELEAGDDGFLGQKVAALGVASSAELAHLAGVAVDEAERRLHALALVGDVRPLGDQWTTPAAVDRWRARIVEETVRFHAQNALMPGIPLATARALLPSALRTRAWDDLVQITIGAEGLELIGDALRRLGHRPAPTAKQAEQLAAIEAIYRADGFQINSRLLVMERLSIDAEAAYPLIQHLVANRALVRLDDDTFLHAEAYDAAVRALVEHFSSQPTLTLPTFRDRLGAARKHVQTLLEHFDALRYTARRGDQRVPLRLPELAPRT